MQLVLVLKITIIPKFNIIPNWFQGGVPPAGSERRYRRHQTEPGSLHPGLVQLSGLLRRREYRRPLLPLHWYRSQHMRPQRRRVRDV